MQQINSNAMNPEYQSYYDETMRLWPPLTQGHYIETSYGRTWVNTLGKEDNPVLILLHGMSSSSTMWYPNVGYLSGGFRIVAPDIIGQPGKTISVRPVLSENDLLIWLDEVIGSLGCQQVSIAGMSYGGWIAIQYAIRRPEKVRKLVLLDPAATLVPFKSEFFVKMMISTLFPFPKVRKWFLIWMKQGYEMNKAFAAQMVSGLKSYKPPKGQKTVRARKLHDGELRKLQTPSLILLGDRGVIYDPVVAANRARELLHDSIVEIIRDCSHAINMEQADLINDKIMAFIRY